MECLDSLNCSFAPWHSLGTVVTGDSSGLVNANSVYLILNIDSLDSFVQVRLKVL